MRSILFTTFALVFLCACSQAEAPPPDLASVVAATRDGNEKLVADYLANGADPNASIPTDILHGDIRSSLLSIAVENEHLAIVKLLLKAGANPNGREDWEYPIWWAARSGNLEIVKELLRSGAAIDTQHAGNGTTALHAAIYFGHPKVVQFLLDHGADVTRRTLSLNPWGIYNATPRELARRLRHDECVRILTVAESQRAVSP